MAIGSQGKNSRQFDDLKMIKIVPLSVLLQNSRNEKYIQISITDWNLHLPGNYVNRRLQEETFGWPKIPV